MSPFEIHLGPFRYVITIDPGEWEASGQDPADQYGYTDHERGAILIHPNVVDEMRRVVLIHELMHAAAFASGLIHNRKLREEEWVLSTAPLLLDALLRSPRLRRELFERAAQ